jgi:tRNA threonylcarbamoyladenosine biosynthesis protein TsaE
MDIGCDEYFDSGNHCFIEWPSKIPALIPDEYMMVHIKEEADQSRTIDLRMHE